MIKSGDLFEAVGLPTMYAAHDRFMMCGSPDMIAEASALLTRLGFAEGNHGEAGHFVNEKAFVAK